MIFCRNKRRGLHISYSDRRAFFYFICRNNSPTTSNLVQDLGDYVICFFHVRWSKSADEKLRFGVFKVSTAEQNIDNLAIFCKTRISTFFFFFSDTSKYDIKCSKISIALRRKHLYLLFYGRVCHPIPWHPWSNTRLVTKSGYILSFVCEVRGFPKLFLAEAFSFRALKNKYIKYRQK